MSEIALVAKALPAIYPVRRLLMRWLKRATVRILTLFLFWCIAVHASVVCIMHCQAAPWLDQLLDQPLPLFVCDFGGRTSAQDAPTSPKTPLPEIIQLMALAMLLIIGCLLSVVGSIAPLRSIPLNQSLPPQTPPPRSAGASFSLPC